VINDVSMSIDAIFYKIISPLFLDIMPVFIGKFLFLKLSSHFTGTTWMQFENRIPKKILGKVRNTKRLNTGENYIMESLKFFILFEIITSSDRGKS
jgi:hypothetical protein